MELYGMGKRGFMKNKNSDSEGNQEIHRIQTSFLSLDDWAVDREKLYQERLNNVNDVCNEYKVKNFTSNSSLIDFINLNTKSDKDYLVERVSLNQFYISRPHQVSGCLINKVASSSIVKSFLALDGLAVKNVKSPHGYANRLHPKTWNELDMVKESFLNFLIVRDPLERLVSCYKDKMVSNTHWSLASFRKQVKYRAGMIRKKRLLKLTKKMPKRSNEKNSSDMAKQFWSDQKELTVINNKTENGNSTASDLVKTPKSFAIQPRPEDIPSFADFLEFILSTDLMGVGFSSHWVPYWRACTPCHFHYDVIAKLETGEDDLAYIWRQARIESEAPIPWENKSTGGERKKELKDFFSSIPRSLLLRVFLRYRLDYEMFGYDINDALKLGGHKALSKDDLKKLETMKRKHS